jgi:hypothetical protein
MPSRNCSACRYLSVNRLQNNFLSVHSLGMRIVSRFLPQIEETTPKHMVFNADLIFQACTKSEAVRGLRVCSFIVCGRGSNANSYFS